MKKLFTLVLAIALVFALATTCFAAPTRIEAVGALDPQDVTATVGQAPAPGTDTIAVDVEWTAFVLAYTPAGNGTWNTTEHQYAGVASEWEVTSGNVIVSNHSDVDIQATIAFAATTGNEALEEDVSFTLGQDQDNIISKGTRNAQGAVTDSITYTIAIAEDAAAPAAAGKIGTVTLTLAKYVAPQA